jgi:glycosyltransferase involved in cell wall biosynthesis
VSILNLLMVNYEFPPIGGGGGNAHLFLLSQYANNTNLKADVLTSAPKPGFTKVKLSENVTIYKVGLHKKDMHFWKKTEVIEWLLKAGFHYRKLLRENNYDLVHAFFGFPTGWLCYRTANKLPYIISLRGSDVPGYNVRLKSDYRLLSGLFRRIWSSAAIVVANSSGLRNLALKFMPSIDITVIPNGIDTEKFHPSENQDFTKPVRLLTVSRLIERKRVDLLIKAVYQIKKLGLDVRLNIAGEGNLDRLLQKLAHELKITDSILFLGRISAEQMPQVYRDNDIFVMSSEHEGMSNAMLEAMASGLPIVTTRCEGVEELIMDNGIVVEEAQANQIAEAIQKLAGDQRAYKKMSTAARKRSQEFNWKSVADKYIDSYRKVLKEHRDKL